MNTEKEKQHYVPKFYLRHFSFNNNTKQIGVFNVNTNFFMADAKLKTQAYKPYYYGRDGRIEEMLSRVEGRSCIAISKIIGEKQIPKTDSDEFLEVILFVILTQLRNPTIEKNILSSRQELIKRAKEFAPNGDLPEEKLPNIMSHEEMVELALSNIKTGMLYCGDLSVKLLINNTMTPFLTSDNPVVKYNQYLEVRNYPYGWIGYGTVGLQIIIPLSPRISLMLYDGWAYKVGDKQKGYIELVDKDVDQLNMLQILNCNSNIFFNEKLNKAYLQKLKKVSEQYHKFNEPDSSMVRKFDVETGKVSPNSMIVSVGTKNVATRLVLTNCTITKKAKRHIFDNRVVQLRPWALTLRNAQK
jgi:hypothetical protein